MLSKNPFRVYSFGYIEIWHPEFEREGRGKFDNQRFIAPRNSAITDFFHRDRPGLPV